MMVRPYRALTLPTLQGGVVLLLEVEMMVRPYRALTLLYPPSFCGCLKYVEMMVRPYRALTPLFNYSGLTGICRRNDGSPV